MPDAYRKTLIRQISQHAHSEIVGQLPEGNWVTRAPTLEAQVDPAGQDPGRSRPRPVPLQRRGNTGRVARRIARRAAQRQGQVLEHLQLPDLTWADMGAIGWLVDGSAIINQIPLCRCSYGPYARAMVRVCKEESFHARQGYDIMMALCQRHGRAEGDGAGCAEPLVVAGADDVRPVRRRIGQQRAVGPVAHQAALQRRTAPAHGRPDRAAGRVPRA